MTKQIVTEAKFKEAFQDKLVGHFGRALDVFRNYGEAMSVDVTTVLLHAIDKEKVEEVIKELETHWEKVLQFQHPEIRGRVNDVFGINQTQATFLHICRDTLGLLPTRC